MGIIFSTVAGHARGSGSQTAAMKLDLNQLDIIPSNLGAGAIAA